MGSMLFRAIVAPFHLLLDWPKSLFIFFCKMLWKNPNKLFDQPSTFHPLKRLTSGYYGVTFIMMVFCMETLRTGEDVRGDLF